MSEIAALFERCKAEKRAAFIPYLTGGDPDIETSAELLKALATAGADLIEIGVPFSDPIADGPTNQLAAVRALEAGTTLGGILSLVAGLRAAGGPPVVLFTYYNPILAYGVERFAEQASASGVSGILCVDLPPEEAAHELLPALEAHGIDPIFLLAPTSSRSRERQVQQVGRGFVYYVSRRGVTGSTDELPAELAKAVQRLRRKIKLPVAVGFGIATPEQAAEVAQSADGVVVGSALVRMIEEGARGAELIDRLSERVRALVETMPRKAGWFS